MRLHHYRPFFTIFIGQTRVGHISVRVRMSTANRVYPKQNKFRVDTEQNTRGSTVVCLGRRIFRAFAVDT